MKRLRGIRHGAATACLLFCASAFAVAGEDENPALFDRMAALDAAVFDAFNHCSDPVQLKIHASYFSPDVEFYHDNGGVTWNRDGMIAKTRNNVCGKFSREIVPNTLQVFPIKGYGAITRGSHRFCSIDTKSCDGIAEFVIVWANEKNGWQITRVLSFGHRPNK